MMIVLWIGYTLFLLGIIVAIIIWAKRNRQFSEQEHASRLPLEIEDDVIKID